MKLVGSLRPSISIWLNGIFSVRGTRS